MKQSDKDIDLISMMAGHAEFVPVISKEDEDMLLNEPNAPETVPILPIRQNVLFPGVILPIAASRRKSVKLLRQAERNNGVIGVLSQNNDKDDPEEGDLYRLGVLAHVLKVVELPNNTTMAIVQGTTRFVLQEVVETVPYMVGSVSMSPEHEIEDMRQFKAVARRVRKQYAEMLKVRHGSDSLSP